MKFLIIDKDGFIKTIGATGARGPGITVFQQLTEPLTAIPGDIWIVLAP